MGVMPERSEVSFRPSYRIVSSRFPPIGIFDDIARHEDIDAVFLIEGMTNPRLRESLGLIDLVLRNRRASGPGTTPIMSAFTHLNRDGSRFSDGSYGVYYAALEQITAIHETVYHRQRFLSHTHEPACQIQMRCYLGDVVCALHDIRGGFTVKHDPGSYAASQALAGQLRVNGSDGIVFDSVRHAGGQCVAVFYPDRVAPVRQGPHLSYHWDGKRIGHVTVANEAHRL